MGHESKDDLEPAKGKYIEGEIIDVNADFSNASNKKEKYIFNLPNTMRAVVVNFK